MRVGNLGYEHISDRDKRQDKVEKLKVKIQSELKVIRKSEVRLLNTFNMNKPAYKECIMTLATLFAIEDFIKDPDVFMRYHSKYLDDDIIIYVTHEYFLDIMLQENFDFCQRILTHLVSQNDGFYYIGSLLYEKNLIHAIISIFDEIEYDSKQEETSE